MENLTTLTTAELKKDIFNACHELFPEKAQYEETGIHHLFHALKITKYNEEKYNVKDMSREKPVEITNKFLLYKVREELQSELSLKTKEFEIEIAEEALANMLDERGEPVQREIEEATSIFKEASILEQEVQD